MKKIILLASLFIVSASNAQENEKTLWLGAGAGVSYLENNKFDNEVISTKLELGYNIFDNFSVYASHDYIQDLYIDEIHFAGLGVKGSYALSDNVSFFGKVSGLYPVDSNTVVEQVSPSAGVGISYKLSNSVYANLGFDYIGNIENSITHDDLDIKQAYVGINYFFGQSPDVIIQEVVVEKIITKEKEIVLSPAPSVQSHYISFNVGSSDLDEESKFKLNNIANENKDNDNYRLKIIGRTDSSGSDEINEKLSNERIDIVLKNLISMGLNEDRLITESKEDTQPIYFNDNPVFERSVEIIITKE